MLLEEPLLNALSCLAFWAVLVLALWMGHWQADAWLHEVQDGPVDIHDFPEEVGGARVGEPVA
jgi:hypothetical protein